MDGSTRPQMVVREANPRYYDMIQAFGQKAGVPMVLNTSFNLKGEPREVEANGPDVARTWFLQKDDGNEIEIIAEEDGLVTLAQKQRLSYKGEGNVQVATVEPGSFAEDIGLAKGDVIVEMNRQPVNSPEDIKKLQGAMRTASDASRSQ